MNASLAWMVRNPVAANLSLLVLVVGGLLAAFTIKQEVFPEIALDVIQVTVVYPGAGPEEIEEGVLLKIEESLSAVASLGAVHSFASEGRGTVNAEIIPGEDADRVLAEVKSAVDRITIFPRDAERPIVAKRTNRMEVITLVVYGEATEKALRRQAEMIRDELLALEGISQAELAGVRPYEISVQVSEGNLRRHGISLAQIAKRLQAASVDMPGGSIRSAGGEIMLRTQEKLLQAADIGEVAIIERPDGRRLKLSDIAEIEDSFAEIDQFTLFNGKPAAMVVVYRVGEEKPTQVARLVKEYAAQKGASFPPSLRITTINDHAQLFASRLNLLLKNAFLGLILVFVILGLFLEVRLALLVLTAIPVSFLGALFFMPSLDVSINMISLFAFILVLGIVVDNTIVVGESIHVRRFRGDPPDLAAVGGVTEVATPVIYSVLTTVAAFVPLLFVTGLMGKFLKAIPLVVIPVLLISLIQSLYILPAQLALIGKNHAGRNGRTNPFRGWVNGWMDSFLRGPYRSLLSLCISWRYTTLAVACALLMAAGGVVAGGMVRFIFMSDVDSDRVVASLEMPIGTSVAQTDQIRRQLEAAAMKTVTELEKGRPGQPGILENVYSVVGGTIAEAGPGMVTAATGSHLAETVLLLTESEIRGVPAAQVAALWRRHVGEIRGAEALTFTATLMRMGANIDLEISHGDPGILLQAARRLKEALNTYPGVTDIADSHAPGKKELKLRLRPEAGRLGITEEDLALQVRAAFFGMEAFRIQREREEIKVMVRYPQEERQHPEDWRHLRVRGKEGLEMALEQAALVEEGRGYSIIKRSERKRVINVTATVEATGQTGEILADLQRTILADLSRDYPGFKYRFAGEEKERQDSMVSMGRGLLVALFVIYALLAIPLGNYSQPFIIMAVLPFGFIGALGGHLLWGYDIGMLSLFGIVAVCGVVVNNSLILIDYINRRLAEGATLLEASLDAGQRRFRPILCTSLTTFFGLVPMIAERSIQAQFLVPMAISLAYGVLLGMVISLLLTPALCLILEDAKSFVSRRR